MKGVGGDVLATLGSVNGRSTGGGLDVGREDEHADVDGRHGGTVLELEVRWFGASGDGGGDVLINCKPAEAYEVMPAVRKDDGVLQLDAYDAAIIGT